MGRRTVGVHADGPAAGSLDVYTVEPPTTMHSDADGQATAPKLANSGGTPMIALVHAPDARPAGWGACDASQLTDPLGVPLRTRSAADTPSLPSTI